MGRWPDWISEGVAWGLAVAFALMLVIGPQIIGEDEPAANVAGAAPGGPGYSAGAAPAAAEAGKTIFVSTCGGCHTLAAAGTSGAIGPALDGRPLDAPSIAATVRKGRGSMPAFGEQLAVADIAAVAAFVAASSGK